jgi:hypothetical protein
MLRKGTSYAKHRNFVRRVVVAFVIQTKIKRNDLCQGVLILGGLYCFQKGRSF